VFWGGEFLTLMIVDVDILSIDLINGYAFYFLGSMFVPGFRVLRLWNGIYG
jgi:hypothetical protein